MDAQSIIPEIELGARRQGISVTELCVKVSIHRATWQRWKIGKGEPRASQWIKLNHLREQYRSV